MQSLKLLPQILLDFTYLFLPLLPRHFPDVENSVLKRLAHLQTEEYTVVEYEGVATTNIMEFWTNITKRAQQFANPNLSQNILEFKVIYCFLLLERLSFQAVRFPVFGVLPCVVFGAVAFWKTFLHLKV